jgi:hypothetical protein
MAAQSNPWGTMDRSAGTRPRKRESAWKHRQDYRQPTMTPVISMVPLETPDWFEDTLADLRLNPGTVLFEVFTEDATPSPLSSVLASVDELVAPDPDGDVPATEHAYQSARAVLEAAYGRLLATKPRANLPAPVVTTDDIGGVRVSWQLGERHVRTNFGATPNQNSYLYFESPTEHAADALQPTALSTRLEWMIKP